MLCRLKNKKGQNTAEYAILIGLIVAAAVAMQTYVKRGLQGRVRDAVDTLAVGTSNLGTTGQYEPYYLESSFNVTSGSTVDESELAAGAVSRNTARDTTSRTGTQTYTAPE